MLDVSIASVLVKQHKDNIDISQHHQNRSKSLRWAKCRDVVYVLFQLKPKRISYCNKLVLGILTLSEPDTLPNTTNNGIDSGEFSQMNHPVDPKQFISW